MEGFSILRAIILSFYSKEFYREAARKWRGRALVYLVVLLAICWAARTIKFQIVIMQAANQDGKYLVQQCPDITITNGRVSTNVETPYLIKRPDGTTIAIVDLTGQYTSLENTTAKILLTRDHLEYGSKGRTKRIDLKRVKSFHMDQSRAQKWLHFGRTWLAPASFVVLMVLFSLYRVVQALIYALIGMIFAKIMKVALDYLTLFRLAIVAVTPAIIANTLHSLLDLHTPMWGTVCFLIAMGYLLFAVKANAGQEHGTPEEPAPEPPSQ